LHFPDFRAAERTFQLGTQVAGRTGRGDKGGSVRVQTFSPDHVAIQTATRHDFAMFAQQELPIRAEFQSIRSMSCKTSNYVAAAGGGLWPSSIRPCRIE
jgi:hypothetical protein